MSMRNFAAGLGLVLLTTLAGCGDDGTGSKAGAATGRIDIDPCSLLTDAEVTSLLGDVEVPGGVEDDLPTDSLRQCTWFAEDPSPLLIAGLTMQVMKRPADVEQLAGADVFDYTVKPVSGLGEEAYIGLVPKDPQIGNTGNEVAVVVVAQGQVAVTLSIMLDVYEGTPEYTTVIGLAQAAIDRT